MSKVVFEAENRITKRYGNGHTGIDVGWRKDENQNKIYAHSKGKVVAVVTGKGAYNKNDGSLATYGNYVDIKHENGYMTRYAHLREVFVKVGDSVESGTYIAIMGESGFVIGRHQHFEVFKDGIRLNPEEWLNKDFPLTGKVIRYQSYDNKKRTWLNNIEIGKFQSGIMSYAGNFGNSIGGVYADEFKIRVHDKVKNQWLPWVKNRNDYAGNLGNAIDGIQIEGAKYRAHLKNGEWLSWISKVDNTANGYAGIYGREIDAIQIEKL